MHSLEALATYLFEIGKTWEEVNFYMSQNYDNRGRAIHIIEDNTPLTRAEVVEVVDILSSIIDPPLIVKSILESYNDPSNPKRLQPKVLQCELPNEQLLNGLDISLLTRN